MAKRLSLREFQEGLADKLRAASTDAGEQARLSFEAGGRYWLVTLAEAGEVLPLPDITPVPLTRPWFAGVASLRGVLYGISDFSAFLGSPPTVRAPENRLLLLGQPFGVNVALLVSRLMGLRHTNALSLLDLQAEEAPWIAQRWRDSEGTVWNSLDAAQLISHRAFLEIAID